jgi:hypothetical protein
MIKHVSAMKLQDVVGLLNFFCVTLIHILRILLLFVQFLHILVLYDLLLLHARG